MKRYNLLILAIVLLGTTLISCGENNGSSSSKTISSISISPTVASIEVGQSQVFSCIATYTDNTTGAIIPTWTLTGEVGTLESIGLNGLLTATQEGSGTVMSTSSGFFAIATISVEAAGSLTTIEVTPAYATLRVGQTQAFVGSGTNSSGDAISINPTWTITGDAIGTIVSSGATATVSATALGTAYVNCTSLEVTTSAILTIEGYYVEITAEADTYVDSANPSANYSNSQTLLAGKTATHTYEAYFYFNIANVTPAITSVEAATLKLYATSPADDVNIGRLLSKPIMIAVKWTNKPTHSLIKPNTFSSGLNSIEFQSEVIFWLTTNNGIAIYEDLLGLGSVTLGSQKSTDDSQRPKIQIYYK